MYRFLLKRIRYIYNPRFWVLKEIITKMSLIIADKVVVYLDQFSGSFNIDIRSDIFFRLIHSGKYEEDLSSKIKDLIDPSKDAIDIGANIGFFTVLIANIIHEKSKVLSIEASKNMFSALKENVSINNLNDKVILHYGAASFEEGEIKINVIEGKEEYSSIKDINHPNVSEEKFTSELVECTTVDFLVEKFDLNPSILKIDVEGAEDMVISGASKTFSLYRPHAILELNDHNGNKDKIKSLVIIKEFFDDLNYKVLDLDGNCIEDIMNVKSGNYLFSPK